MKEVRRTALKLQGFSFAYPSMNQSVQTEPINEPSIGSPLVNPPIDSPLVGSPLVASPLIDSPLIGPLDFELKEGDFLLLTGSTGCGKTTLLRNIKPELAPAGNKGGELYVFGTAINELTPLESAETIGYVAQNPETQMICDTVWHELAFGLENIGTDSATMRRRVAEVSHFFGIEPWFHGEISKLSGGQKQIVALASSLCLRPKLLLLDEPTAQLDPVAERNFLHALFRVNRELGITVIVATHQPETMRNYATKEVVLRDGQLLDIELSKASENSKESETPNLNPGSNTNFGDWLTSAQKQTTRVCHALQIKNAFVRYSRRDTFILRGCTLAVSTGSIHALIGANGCGKSTLLKTAAGTLTCSRGSVQNNHVNNQVYLPQNPLALFVRDSVWEELQEWQKACGYSDEDIHSQLARFNLENHVNLHPYDLSGGQRQCLALAKLLLAKPDLLLLDEPTKGLDPQSKMLVAHALIQEANAGKTIVLTTHDLSFVDCVATDVSLLFDGQIACTQPTKEFFKENIFYRPLNDEFHRNWIALTKQQPSNQTSVN